MKGECSPFFRMFIASLDFMVCSGVFPDVFSNPRAIAASTISGGESGCLVICRTSYAALRKTPMRLGSDARKNEYTATTSIGSSDKPQRRVEPVPSQRCRPCANRTDIGAEQAHTEWVPH